MIAGVWIIILATVCIISGINDANSINDCERQRIRTFYKNDFTWKGIAEEVKEGIYQPKCQ